MIQAVIFDMDGVLFDTERVGIQMAQKAAAEQGVDMPVQVQLDLLGANQAACHARYNQLFGAALDSGLFHQRWYALMLAYSRERGMPLKHGLPQALEKLKTMGVKLGVATSNTRAVAEEYLVSGGIRSYFDALTTGDQVERSKPAPDIYLKAAQALGAAPERCVGVEDSFNGVQAVRAAGMTCVMVPDILPYEEKHGPFVDQALKSLEMFPCFLKNMNS